MSTVVMGWDEPSNKDIILDLTETFSIKIIPGFYGGNLPRVEITKWNRRDEPKFLYQGICRDNEHWGQIVGMTGFNVNRPYNTKQL